MGSYGTSKINMYFCYNQTDGHSDKLSNLKISSMYILLCHKVPYTTWYGLYTRQWSMTIDHFIENLPGIYVIQQFKNLPKGLLSGKIHH